MKYFRKVYTVIEALGEAGGLFKVITFIGYLLVFPFYF
jgi:hypothetical protein